MNLNLKKFYSNLINSKWTNRIILFSLSFILIFNFVVFYLISVNNSIEINIDDKTSIKICKLNSNDIVEVISKYDEILIESSFERIDVFPDVKNLTCLGKIIDFWNEDGQNSIHLIYGENIKLYRLYVSIFNFIFLTLLVLIRLLKHSKSEKIYFFSSYFISNFFIVSIFSKNNIIFDGIPEYRYFFDIVSILLIFLALLFNKQFFYIATLYFFILFDYDYFPIIALIFIFNINEKNEFKVYEKYLLYFLPVTFILSRFIASLSNKFDHFWSLLFQQNYFGYSRFIDLQGDFLRLKCHYDPSAIHQILFNNSNEFYVCPEYDGYGPLRQILYIKGDIWNTVLLTFCVIMIIYLFHFFSIIKRKPKNLLFVTLVFISPSVNFLIHTGNPDIFYFSTLYFVLYKYKNNPIFYSFLIYLFTLWKIHAIGILFGLLIFSLIKEDGRITFVNLLMILTTIGTYILNSIFNESLSIPGAPDERVGFGILHDIKYILRNTIYSGTKVSYYIYFLFLILCLIISLKISQKIVKKNNFYNYEMFGLIFWFFLSMIYENQSYRLPLFIFIFISIYSYEQQKIRYLVAALILLNPTLSVGNILIEKASLIFNRAGLYFIFIYLLAIIFAYLRNFMAQKEFLKFKNFNLVE